MPAKLYTTVQIALASCKTAGNRVVRIWLSTQCTAVGAFSVAANAGVPQSAKVDVGTWCICLIAVPSGDVAKEGNESASPIDAIAAANLVDISGAGEIAVDIRVYCLRPIVAAPTLLGVLSPSEDETSSRALCDAIKVGVIGTRINIGLQLTSRIVLSIAAAIAVDCLLRQSVQRRCLFTNSIAGELDILLAETGIVQVHSPLGGAIVWVDIDLTLRC